MNRIARARDRTIRLRSKSWTDRGDIGNISAEALVAEFQTSCWVTEGSTLIETGLDSGVICPDDFILENALGSFSERSMQSEKKDV